MCLYVDYSRDIYDDRVYTFYKLVAKTNKPGVYESWILGKRFLASGYLIARNYYRKPLPESGQEAYNKYAVERTDCSGNFEGRVNEGIHAYTTLVAAKKAVMIGEDVVIIKVHVLGKHIIAFSSKADAEVAFTRGQIVGECKLR